MFKNLNLELKNELDKQEVMILMGQDGTVHLTFGSNTMSMDIGFVDELIDALTIIANARLRMEVGEE